MKNKKIFLVTLFCLFTFITRVNAEYCDYERKAKINNEAANVNVTHETYEDFYMVEGLEPGKMEQASQWYGIVHIYNVTPNLKVTVTDRNGKKYNFDYKNVVEDTITLNAGLAYEVNRYTVDVYYSDSECGKEPVRSLNITIPRYNNYSEYAECATYPDYYYCKQFITLDDITEKQFHQGIKEYAEQLKTQEKEEKKKQSIIYKTTSFLKKNWLIISLVVIVIIGGVAFIIIKKRKDRIV